VVILLSESTEHPAYFFKDEVLFIHSQLILGIVFFEDSYLDVGQSLLIGSWAFSEV
jgi:hypothetical protein